MKVKTFLSLLLSWAMAASAWADGDLSMLLLLLKDGSKLELNLPTQKPEIRCSHGIMQIDYLANGYASTSMTFERDQIESLKVLDESEVVALDATKDDSQSIRFDMTRPGVVNVSGLQDTDRLQVFTLDGKSISTSVSRNGKEASVDLSNQKQGVYIVSVNQRFTFKLMKP